MDSEEVVGPNDVKEVRKFGYSVSFKKSIGRMMRNPHILQHIGVNYESIDGILRDECDGSNCKEHAVINERPSAIKIRLYYDDVEMTTPIGSKKVSIGNYFF